MNWSTYQDTDDHNYCALDDGKTYCILAFYYHVVNIVKSRLLTGYGKLIEAERMIWEKDINFDNSTLIGISFDFSLIGLKNIGES